MVSAAVFYSSTKAQNRYDWRTHVDQVLEETDSLSLKTQKFFYLTKYKTWDQPYKESWYYTLKNDKVIYYEIRYQIDSSEFSETYYLDNGRLVCMEKYESDPMGYYEDEIRRGSVYFFENDRLLQIVTVGPQPRGYRRPDPYYEGLSLFYKRWEELKKNMW